MTSLADQTTEELGGRLSVLWRQKSDHIELDRLLKELDAATTREEEDRVLQRIYRLVFPHAFAEETVLWPVIRRLLPEGEALTLEVEQEHQEVNELVRSLEDEKEPSADRALRIERLAAVLREDVRDEEDELLPRLQEKLSVPQLRALGVAWEAVRRISPTRAHPVVARRPPGNVLSSLPLSAVDRLRDGADVLARGDVAPHLVEPAQRGLTRAARRLEGVGPFRRGEHPSTHSGD
ncbi:hemerythrin domain-containing protein [Aeromicrobium phragmitis]|uniref:Hemerythrin domain-containing protein n=1 Tax=Aeromicrobium phragmitis TaxID=2478914 RepID=A0A3L8PLC4_9ACTN|nr:hemerythrin domain-containing protein [Aeromicrobium phragmitis]RLV55523.1 hemerythrin domain-containing protein [Aeromicrobium phragmitis]